jgi:hypothetical protein
MAKCQIDFDWYGLNNLRKARTMIPYMIMNSTLSVVCSFERSEG